MPPSSISSTVCALRRVASQCRNGDYTETTECVRDEPDETTGAAGGVYALRGGGDVGLQISERAELRDDDGTELCTRG